MPGENPGLDRAIKESLNTAQRRVFLIEFTGELRSDGATFMDLLAEMALELGFAVIHPDRFGKVDEPLSLLEQILGEFTPWEKLSESLPEEMKGDLDLIGGGYSRPAGPASTSPEGMLALADAWYDAGKLATSTFRDHYRDRAAYWYRRAVNGLSGLPKTRVQKRLDDIKLRQLKHGKAP